MRLYRRGEVWHGSYYDASGHRVRTSTHCTDRRAAELFLRRREREAHGEKSLPRNSSALSVEQALVLFTTKGCATNAPATVRMYEKRSGHLARYFDGVDVAELTVERVTDYATAREDEGAARETVRKELVTLKRALETAKILGHFSGEPRALMPRWKVRYVPRKRWLTVKEFRALLAALDNPRHRLWLLLAVYTGARMSEVSALTWGDYDAKARTLRIQGTKTDGSDRHVPVPGPLRTALKGKHGKDEPIAGPWLKVNRDLARACVRAKVKRVSPNDLRRTYASWLVQSGQSSFVVAQLLGHKTSRMVELVYGRLSAATMAQAVKGMPAASR